MIEIIVLIFLSKRVKFIVEPKGYKPFNWQLKCILLWFGTEVVGLLASILIFGSDIYTAALSGLLCAIAAAIAYFRYIQNLPDLNSGDNWIDRIGQEQDHF